MKSIRSQIIVKLYRLSGSPFNPTTPITQQRARLEKQSRYILMPSQVDVQPVSIGEMYAEWLIPRGAEKDQVILFLHGGGYTMGSCNTHRPLASRIAKASHVKTLIINYRLAPENPFPAALEDTKAAYHWLMAHKINAHRIILAGDSAGGGLAVALAISLRDEDKPLPAGIICISPWLDLTLSGETMISCADSDFMLSQATSSLHASSYVGQHDPKSPLISPIFADLKKLPPLLIQAGEYEILQSDSVHLAENARKAGVEATIEIWDGMWHDWHMFAGFMPESQRAINHISQFISERLNLLRY